jgi:hypothetical protein
MWEVWNEPDMNGLFWCGTFSEFVQMINTTALAVKAGNPSARVLCSGFYGNGQTFASNLLANGVGPLIDIFSVHYLDQNYGWFDQWRAIMARYGLGDKPLMNSEESSAVPLNNLAASPNILASMRYMHVNADPAVGLTTLGFIPSQQGVMFSVASHFLAGATYLLRMNSDPAKFPPPFNSRSAIYQLYRQANGQLVAALQGLPTLYGGVNLTFQTTPLVAGSVLVTDQVGGSTAAQTSGTGMLKLVMTGAPTYITGVASIQLVSIAANPSFYQPFEAEAPGAQWSAGWVVTSNATGWSNQTYMNIWMASEPVDPNGYWGIVPFSVETSGTYNIILAGSALSLLGPPAGTSPFQYNVDGGLNGAMTQVDAASQVTDLSAVIPGMPSGPSQLASPACLAAGNHKFYIKLTARRTMFDTRYAMWFDALVLQGGTPAPTGSTPPAAWDWS